MTTNLPASQISSATLFTIASRRISRRPPPVRRMIKTACSRSFESAIRCGQQSLWPAGDQPDLHRFRVNGMSSSVHFCLHCFCRYNVHFDIILLS
jgi:hypothetical protein